MSALPKAAAQAAAVTACARAVVEQEVVPQSVFIRVFSSFVTVDVAGEVLRPLPKTAAANALVTVELEVFPAYVEPLMVNPLPNICVTSDGVFTMVLQYWMASWATPT